ncbi:MAG: tRNA (adenosine(37)-N6)-threonylcarbamoyltransferase complex ATPase subunit type 1 TsaE [Granulosicoccus sp.]
MKHKLCLSCPDEFAMLALGGHMSSALPKGVLMTLEGELGAGKSFLARAIIHAAGYVGRVKSPTYTLIETYDIESAPDESRHIAHLDLYRLADPDELHYLGLDDVLDTHDLVMIEWPERAGDLLPAADVCVRIDYAESGGRIVTIKSTIALPSPTDVTRLSL